MENPDEKPLSENEESKTLVEQAYDQIADTYLAWTQTKATPRLIYLEKMLGQMPAPSRARVLELGCGAGVPGTQLLSARCGSVVANDLSAAQIERARGHVTGGADVEFRRGDMMGLAFEAGSFDGAVAFYSIIHLPREEQAVMFRRVYTWLREGCHLLCNLAVTDNPGNTTENWLGSQSRMYWSSFDAATNVKLLREAGFTIDEQEVLEDEEDEERVPFLWVLARKTGVK